MITIKVFRRVIATFLVGFVHSHPPNKVNLSKIDIKYAKKVKTHCGLNEILMLIYLPDTQMVYQYVL